MGLFGGGGSSYTPKKKTVLGPSLVSQATPDLKQPMDSPYKMDSNQLSNYRALQVRKIYEGLGATQQLGG